jgi:quercetin 2,3-dioxygenase
VIHAGLFDAKESAELALASGRHAWVQVARGTVRVNGEVLSEGDGVAVTNESVVRIEGVDDGEVLVFDLA